jgi:hypothetical protein
MYSAWYSVLAVIVTVAGLGGSALAEVELPAGPNRDLVTRTCSACHELTNLTDTGGLSREDWDGTLEDMKSYGARFTLEERTVILEYLVTFLPPRKR